MGKWWVFFIALAPVAAFFAVRTWNNYQAAKFFARLEGDDT